MTELHSPAIGTDEEYDFPVEPSQLVRVRPRGVLLPPPPPPPCCWGVVRGGGAVLAGSLLEGEGGGRLLLGDITGSDGQNSKMLNMVLC